MHSKFGSDSESFSIRLKDMLSYKGISAYFDADNLQTISLEKLSEGIVASCCILLVLNDETLDSQWCKHEVECARSLKIPITLTNSKSDQVRESADSVDHLHAK